MKKKLTPTEAKNLQKAWNESENGLNMTKKIASDNRKHIYYSPLFEDQQEKQQNLF